MDQRGPASIYLVSDSRITWSSETWDFGRKLFAARTSADVIGYAGEAFFPTQTLGQIVELVDRGLVLRESTPPEQRLQWIVDSLERSAKSYPRSVAKNFDLLYGTRLGAGMSCSFIVRKVHFTGGRATEAVSIQVPSHSGLIVALGSGEPAFKRVLGEWQSSDVGGTSRAVFSAFADYLQRGSDSFSGGPPQLVGLYRKGAAKTFGIVWNQRRFFCGMEVSEVNIGAPVKWHNDLFEICEANTLSLDKGAQPQPRPRGLG